MSVACGRCIGCRLERARQWAVRCMHEASLHEASAFVTLTYEVAPLGLVPRDLELFWKRLRRSLGGKRISYFACGEYGEHTRRPHYHACIFGYWPDDAVLFKRTAAGHSLYRSATLEKLWGHGFVNFGAVTFESAQYVAGYITKKITGPEAAGYYQAEKVDPETGEVSMVPIEPEFSRSSRRPALGLGWLDKFGETDAWRADAVIARGAQSKVPKYYDRKWKERKTERELRLRKTKRIERGNTRRSRRERTPDRLLASEVTTLSKLKLKARDVS